MNIQKALKKSLLLTAAVTFFVACTSTGKKVEINKMSIVYVKDGVTEEEGKQLGNYLLQVGYFDDKKERTVQMLKDANKAFIVNLVMDKAYVTSHPELRNSIKPLEVQITENVFKGSTVIIKFVDQELKEL